MFPRRHYTCLHSEIGSGGTSLIIILSCLYFPRGNSGTLVLWLGVYPGSVISQDRVSPQSYVPWYVCLCLSFLGEYSGDKQSYWVMVYFQS